jgi:HPt (histidine-containing phosphotransfer) domain-containing protein
MTSDQDNEKKNRVLDLDLAREYMDGDEELLREVLGIYREDVHRKVINLHDAVSKGDAEGVRITAHAIKGSSATVGAISIREISSEIENAGIQPPSSAIAELVDRLDVELKKLDEVIAMEIGMGDTEP